jgi:hypothetical protein
LGLILSADQIESMDIAEEAEKPDPMRSAAMSMA